MPAAATRRQLSSGMDPQFSPPSPPSLAPRPARTLLPRPGFKAAPGASPHPRKTAHPSRKPTLIPQYRRLTSMVVVAAAVIRSGRYPAPHHEAPCGQGGLIRCLLTPGPRPGPSLTDTPNPVPPPQALTLLPPGACSQCHSLCPLPPHRQRCWEGAVNQHRGGGSLTSDLSLGTSATPAFLSSKQERVGSTWESLPSAYSAEHLAGTDTHTRRSRATLKPPPAALYPQLNKPCSHGWWWPPAPGTQALGWPVAGRWRHLQTGGPDTTWPRGC